MEDHAAKLKRDTAAAAVADLKAALIAKLHDIGPANQAAATIAMLEIAFKRFVDTHGEQDGLELIQTTLRKSLAKNATLQ